MQLYLASSSPRRRELLNQLGISFDILIPQINEDPKPYEEGLAYVKRMAKEKADAAQELIRQKGLKIHPVLAADTCVVINDKILSKPMDRNQGLEMLRELSGSTHDVFTAVALAVDDNRSTDISKSTVSFCKLTEEEIVQYWDSGEPADKAGAYAIQGYGSRFITRISGSYTGIVGLPLYEVSQLLKRAGIKH